MTDIVERLRLTTEQMANNCSVNMTLWCEHSGAALEAAAEIERLRLSLSEAIAQRDAAFEMSKCECGTDEACRNLVEARATGRREGMEEAAGVLETCLITVPLTPGTADGVSITKRQGAAAIRAAMEKEE